MYVSRAVLCLLAVLGLTACDGASIISDAADADKPLPDICWDTTISPAVIETVTEQVLVQPAELGADGTVLSPAIHETRTHQQIVQERLETRSEALCDHVLTPEFIKSVQRALQVRTLYYGQINGEMDVLTRSAIREYQQQQGFDTDTLLPSTARQMGLITVTPQEG